MIKYKGTFYFCDMDKPIIIGICGGSGSGKTSFVRRLKEDFDSNDLCVISQDDYYKPREEQFVDENGIQNFDLLTAIDHEQFESDVRKILAKKSISKKEYTFNNELAEAKMITTKPADIIIVEGLFVFHLEGIRDLMDLRIFIHTSDEDKLSRRIKRDAIERNYPLEDVTYRYEHHVLPSYKSYIEPYKSDAHIVVNNNENFDMGYALLQSFIKEKLK